jgi:hypothetical protein
MFKVRINLKGMIMYKTVKYAALMILAFVFATCKDSEESEYVASVFMVDGTIQNVPAGGGVYYLEVLSSVPVEATASEPWCKVDIVPAETGSNAVNTLYRANVTVDANTSVETREATVVVKAQGVAPVSKTVAQRGTVNSITIKTEDGAASGTYSVGDVVQLVGIVEPAGATPNWASGNTDIATVSSTGLLTIVGSGQTIITASIGSIRGTFVVTVVSDEPDTRVGFWAFDTNAPARATIGVDLEPVGAGISTIDGPTADNKAVRVAKGSYFKLLHGIAPGASGVVDEYTIAYDVRVPVIGVYYSLMQSDLDNTNDADYFINPSGKVGVGTSGYHGELVAEKWFRIVIAVSPTEIRFYQDGARVGTYTGTDNRFFWLPAGTLLFADESGEDNDIDIAEVSLWDTALDDTAVQKLGSVLQ